MQIFVPTPAQLGSILRNIRKEKKLTQKEAAEKTGLLPKTVSMLENSPEKCSVESLYKLLSSLDLELLLNPKNSVNYDESEVEW